MSAEELVFNGVDPTTGRYCIPPMSLAQFTAELRGETDPDHLKELLRREQQDNPDVLGLKEGVSPEDLSQSGWGVIFPEEFDPAVYDALRELLEHRQRQAAARKECRYREMKGPLGYRQGETSFQFTVRHGISGGPADPDILPYYLLLVGDPEEIPYSFQYQLDVVYAVGRIHFQSPHEYARYARSVVAAETGSVQLARTVTVFGTQNPDDVATALSSEQLARPVAARVGQRQEWKVDSLIGEGEATKRNLLAALGAVQPPALLFTATHGLGFRAGHADQLRHQGALVCQDWPGPVESDRGLSCDQYLSADDLSDARVEGMIGFLFACFGVGTPRRDDLASGPDKGVLAPRAFVSALPQRMLAHPGGGALAIVGHVERAWGYSFSWPKIGQQMEVYGSFVSRLLMGHSVGYAFEYFNSRYAEFMGNLNDLQRLIGDGFKVNPAQLAEMQLAHNDARGFAILGDPAVRLAVGDGALSDDREGRALAGVRGV